MQDTEDRSGLSRRTVMAGAAWAVPAVVTAAALPAYASSQTKTQVGISIVGVATGQAEPVITLSLSTSAPAANLVPPTSATFSITVTNGDNKSYVIDPTPSTPVTGVTINNPAQQTIAAGASATFTATLAFTGSGTGTSASANITLAGWAKQKNLSVSVAYTSGTAALSNGTLIAPTTNPVTFTN